MTKKQPPQDRNYTFKQSFNTGEDQDVLVREPGSKTPRDISFKEKVYTDAEKNAPKRDMDTDLGA